MASRLPGRRARRCPVSVATGPVVTGLSVVIAW